MLAAALVAAAAAAAAAAARVSVAPPHGGGWKIKPYSFGVAPGSPGIDELTGTFSVSGGGTAVTNLKGTTQHAVNSGCNAGVAVQLLGSAAITHVSQPAPQDFYRVGAGADLWKTVKLTFRARGAKSATAGTGRLRIYFPGGTSDISQGNGIGNLQATNKVIGICNLNFDVR